MSATNIRMRVELKDVSPQIWREFVAASTSSLDELHNVLQHVMGWTNSHLHEFVVRGTRYAPHERDDDLDDDVEETSTTSLSDLALEVGDSFLYMYDFGDGWEHDVTVLGYDEQTRAPECLAGAGACPPEDCGGPPGYADMIATLSDPAHPERSDIIEWLGRELQPDEFDVDATNTALRRR